MNTGYSVSHDSWLMRVSSWLEGWKEDTLRYRSWAAHDGAGRDQKQLCLLVCQ